MPAQRAHQTLEAATHYRSAGISVIPLQPRGKKPAYNLLPRDRDGFAQWEIYQQRLATEDELARWFGGAVQYNLGVVCGTISGGLVVVDFDAPESYDKWSEQDMTRWLLPTVETSHGRHIYVRVKDEIKGNHRNQSRKIDLRGEGGYVVAPPSVHETGFQYRWVMGQWTNIPTISRMEDIGLPDAIFLRDPVVKTMPPLKRGQRGMPLSIYSFVAQGTREGNRDRKAYWSACECREAGIPPSQAVEWIAMGLSSSHPDRDPHEWAVEKVRSAYGSQVH